MAAHCFAHSSAVRKFLSVWFPYGQLNCMIIPLCSEV